MGLSRKKLAIALSRLEGFMRQDPLLEQYPTPPDIAAEMLVAANERGDIDGKSIIDLGAGTGILGIGALLLGAAGATFIEKDPAVQEVLYRNLAIAEVGKKSCVEPHDLALTDVNGDTALLNPPFGTRAAHADIAFLSYAIAHATAVYSFHKTSTVPYLRAVIASLGARIQEERRFRFPLRCTMPHHRKPVEHIDVTLLIITTRKA